jgi:hypothetical protein
VRRTLIPALLALMLAGCAAGAGADQTTTLPPGGGRVAAGDPVTVAQAIATATDAPQRVVGYLFVASDGSMVLADAMLESYPPQPGGAAVGVVGFSIEGMTGITTGPVGGALRAWSEGTVEILGTVSDGVLTVFDVPNA